MKVAAIDFETANENRNSICAVGIAAVNLFTGEKKDYYSLIKPKGNYFANYNSMIHGITENDVENAPSFDEVWLDILPEISDHLIIAHNASFDISCLRKTLDLYNLTYPSLQYNCTRNIAKKHWPGLSSYKLSVVADYLDFQFEHHHALEDARASVYIFEKVVNDLGVHSPEELSEKLNMVQGSLYKDGYEPARINKRYRNSFSEDYSLLQAENNEFDSSHPFYNSHVTFTGTLESMTRKEAAQNIVNLGGHFEKGVTKNTNFLILGDQDFNRFANGKKSSKLLKAESNIAQGQNLEIMPEQDFIELL
ncbi:exonuclease domain-containing protein [Salisediminibacterium halotolerans]|uniref:exonuclease domain-containing protein n=1 Tax=Salisediminibacterium halotolerans TaxID=517425 RepID=UPI000EB5C2CD|nr:exonuclease domain-containing protein [Salisediminibacterium halotolerans]RLJ72290.1 DNA polymerase-3 subunit epsilon [Actinophytocola xinjiangensis]RPE85504.1 DNA polymerase-3 subunit epsilon [Salisediminibacterium halotolerans]TWG33459.1 DNA polymerase-3 subunit epsilon [Salisediminibacterium halotolerans]GEL07071.1 DNA polymerase III subunit epsilon [Salisediminibacterium halotolerans]